MNDESADGRQRRLIRDAIKAWRDGPVNLSGTSSKIEFHQESGRVSPEDRRCSAHGAGPTARDDGELPADDEVTADEED